MKTKLTVINSLAQGKASAEDELVSWASQSGPLFPFHQILIGNELNIARNPKSNLTLSSPGFLLGVSTHLTMPIISEAGGNKTNRSSTLSRW